MRNIYALLCIFVGLVISVGAYSQSIIGYEPGQDANDADKAQNLVLTFDQNISFNPNFTFLEIRLYNDDSSSLIETWVCINSSAQPGVTISGDDLIINPSDDLLEGISYHIEIDPGAIDGFGGIDNSELNNWRFATVSSLIYYPLQDAIDVPLITSMTLTFQNSISFNPNFTFPEIRLYNGDADALLESWTCTLGSASPGVSISDNVLTINPTDNLLEGTSYYITIDQGAINGFDGIDNSEGNNWRFTAISYPPIPIIYSPTQDSINVPIDKTFRLTFDRDIQWVNVTSDYYIRINDNATQSPVINYLIGNGEINANLNITSDVLSITLPTALNPNTAYYITVPNGVIESTSGAGYGGINNAADNNWRFTTVGPPIWTSGYPSTRNLSRTNVDIVGRTDKAGTYYYVVTSSITQPSVAQIMNGLDHNGAVALFHNSTAPGTMQANIEFVDVLDIDGIDIAPTTYYVYYLAVSDQGLDSQVGVTSFTTVERDAPTADFNPVDGATNISVSSNILVTYNEAIRNVDGSVIDNTNAHNLVNIPGFSDYSVTIDPTKQILTITPNVPFASSTTYSVIVNPVEDWFGNEQTEVMASSFTTSDFVTWNGSVSSDWSDPDNWTGALVAGFNALIPATGVSNWPNVTTNTGYYVKDIVIEAGAELNIGSMGNLLVTGYFVMTSSNTGKGNASLINNGTLNISSSNKVQIQQNVTSNPTKWMMISSPVAGATQANINCVGVVSEYDMSINEWVPIGANTPMDVAKGYQSYSFENMVFSGAINNASSYNVNALKTTHNGGFNLAGNPYPCSIDWNLLDIGTAGLLNAFWVYLNDSQQYGTYNGNAELGTNLPELGTSVIPSHHAFWVRVPDGELSGALSIPSSARVHNTNTYLKSTKSDNKGVIRLVGVNGESKDEAVIAFNNEAKAVFDTHDTEKRFASKYGNVFEIFSLLQDKKLCINSFDELSDAIIVPIGVNAPSEGNYTIELKEVNNFNKEIEVKLEDLSTGISNFIDMQEVGQYEFSIAQGLTTNRFNLHIQPKNDGATNINTEDSEQIQIYSNNNYLYIDIPNLNNPTYHLFNISGQLIANGQLVGNSLNKVLAMNKGIVIIKVNSREGTFVKKVFVE
ncbi:Ig-like domain-containing protein [Carboxylicivirga mesophila]|uniref:Ig-like domain-containing protein n=1 Tax=Carboxylicivirga mesophila TaxID=1166478 RepID=A0ABS5K9B0_9BACT|nr:Ig-like domain-containing protein [Carboxylicivirga mesophila]MBS2211447.1 Ig-like domain-containing protein [Carboxylicivirga mesophila]